MPDVKLVNLGSRGIIRQDAYDDLKAEAKTRHEQMMKNGALRSYTLKERIGAIVQDHVYSKKLYRGGHIRNDADAANVLARELQYRLAQAKNVLYTGKILELAFPVNTEGGTGMTSVSYDVLDKTGKMKLVAGSGKGLPEVGSKLREEKQDVGVYGCYSAWTQVDSERCLRAGANLNQRKSDAVAEAAAQTKNHIGWFGDPDGANIKGALSFDINMISIVGNWSAASADDIADDLRKMKNATFVLTDGAFDNDSAVLNPDAYSYLNKRFPETGDTIGAYALGTLGFRQILSTSYFNSVTSPINSLLNDDFGCAYPRNSEVAEFFLPRDFTMFPYQQQGLDYISYTLMDTGGVLGFRPECFAGATGF